MTGGYLENYGAAGEGRRRMVRRVALWAVSTLALAGILYFVFHFVIPNRGEKAQVRKFFQLLAAQDYKQAYALWGCTDAKPCRDYPLRLFREDWGPAAVPVTTFEVMDGETCGTGVIVDVDAGKAGDKKLWVDQKSQELGSLPPGFDTCPHSNRIYTFIRRLRYRAQGRTYQ
jgi:hypothetical protein